MSSYICMVEYTGQWTTCVFQCSLGQINCKWENFQQNLCSPCDSYVINNSQKLRRGGIHRNSIHFRVGDMNLFSVISAMLLAHQLSWVDRTNQYVRMENILMKWLPIQQPKKVISQLSYELRNSPDKSIQFQVFPYNKLYPVRTGRAAQ
jgi:hypothetical protein